MARSVIESNSYGFEKANEPFIVTFDFVYSTKALSNPSATLAQIYEAVYTQKRLCVGLAIWERSNGVYQVFSVELETVREEGATFRITILGKNYEYLMFPDSLLPTPTIYPKVKDGEITWNTSLDLNIFGYSVRQTDNVVNGNINLKVNGELGNTSVLLGTVSGVDLPADSMRFPCITANNTFTSFHSAFVQIESNGNLFIRTNDITDEYVIANFSYIV